MKNFDNMTEVIHELGAKLNIVKGFKTAYVGGSSRTGAMMINHNGHNFIVRLEEVEDGDFKTVALKHERDWR